MVRFNHHDQTVDIKNTMAESRNREKVAEVNRDVINMQSEVLRLKIIMEAMLEIMLEQGVDPNLINQKIDAIMERPETFNPVQRSTQPCPKCGHPIIDNGNTPLTGTCLYCGTSVKFAPHIPTEADAAEETEETAENSADELGFDNQDLLN